MSSISLNRQIPYQEMLLTNPIRVFPRGWKVFLATLVVMDIAMLHFSIRLAYQLRYRLDIPFFQYETIQGLKELQTIELLLVPIAILVFVLRGLYNSENLLGGTREYSLVFSSISTTILLVIAAGFLSKGLDYSRGWLVLIWLAAYALTAFGRFCLRRVVYYLRSRGYLVKTAVILGANEEACMLAEQLGKVRASGMRLVGFLDDQLEPGTRVCDGLKCLGPIGQLNHIVQGRGIQEIVVARSALSQGRILEVFDQFGMVSGANLRLSSGLYETITTGMEVREFASVPLVRVNKVRLTGLDQVQKTVLDYAITIPALILSFPFLALIALAVKLDSHGPVIYRRRVMGVNGKQFDAFKFRTMVTNGDELIANLPELQAELAENFKLRSDPRITRLGAFLRKTSLDELPQMFNILRGEMSWVGPRMICPEELEKYNQWGMNLLTVKPGITGKWQVSGRSDISYEQRVRLDMNYIRNWSIWLDIQILWQTVPAVLFRRGAY